METYDVIKVLIMVPFEMQHKGCELRFLLSQPICEGDTWSVRP